MTPTNQPVDASATPRFSAVPSFMRLPVFDDPGDLDIALIGVPWDGGTTNRAGARHGPREIRNMSSFIRPVNIASGVAPYDGNRVGDLGDAPVNPVSLENTMERVERFYRTLHGAGATPLTAGGDHMVTLPILRAIAAQGPLGMVQFDAHSDTNDSYFGGSLYTHGTFVRRAIEEGLLDPRRTVQIGIRGTRYSLDDYDFALQSGIRMITIDEYFDIGVEKTIAEARRVAGDGPTYVSFDIDGIDPAYAPGTGTPEIGGYTTHEAQRMIRGLGGLDLVGGDVVEVAPPFDPGGNTALVGATLMFEILCVLAGSVRKRRGK